MVVEPRQRRIVVEQVWEAILVEFAQKNDIDFAYPTQRFFDNRIEGKVPHASSIVIDEK
jgi:hypothetical protein